MKNYGLFHVPVQTNFQRYFCNISLNQAQTHLDLLKVLNNSEAKFHSNPTTGKEFPHRPRIVKIAHFRQRHNVAESR